ncbi:MAG: nucleotide pyrophosphohydrolase [Candidatus Woesearchaeota archaeon]|nr:nucleotide pyrophosphohydrolase [Candidatus Woesearchaeota archaeon]
MDSKTNIQELKDKIKDFCDKRDWDQFHNPKDLAIGIITEASELLELFRFKSEQEMEAMFANQEKRVKISEELADILYFILRLAQKYNIDLTTEVHNKMAKNEKKYPIEKAKGSNKKYNEL